MTSRWQQESFACQSLVQPRRHAIKCAWLAGYQGISSCPLYRHHVCCRPDQHSVHEQWPTSPMLLTTLLIPASSPVQPVYGAVTDNWPTIEPYFNETGSNCPSILPKAQQQELIDLAVNTVGALGFKHVSSRAKWVLFLGWWPCAPVLPPKQAAIRGPKVGRGGGCGSA